MKKIITILASVFMTALAIAQSPEKMSYQAVIRNNSDVLLTNQTVSMQISILQGSASGTAVYVETHSPTTNANGLASLEIGTGTIVSGNFSIIDWANGPYFIKTETGLAGGTNYFITGTSQLLSVPYALHAKTAESLIGGSSVTTYSVGDFAQGGIVFWVDETGQHGLVCSKVDQNTGVRWYAGTSTNTMARGDGIKAGSMNTTLIIANQGYGDGNTYAARICNELLITEGGRTYGDWYLPSKEELMVMYQNKATIDATAVANGGSSFSNDYYWSSNENLISYGWRQSFDNGDQSFFSKLTTCRVRAIRAF